MVWKVKDGSSNDSPAIVKQVLWIIKRPTWQETPILASFIAVIMLGSAAGTVLGIVVGILSLFSTSPSPPSNTEVSAGSAVTWHRESGSKSGPCEVSQPFLEQIRDELHCGGNDPLNRIENEGLRLREILRNERGEEKRTYPDYFVFYSSPLGGNRNQMDIALSEEVEAMIGVRTFEKKDAQIVATMPIRKLSRAQSFPRDSLVGIERVVVFVFPINATGSRVVSENEFEKFTTTSFEEEDQ